MLIAVAASAAVHAFLMNGTGSPPAAWRAAQTVDTALSVTLSDRRSSFPARAPDLPDVLEPAAAPGDPYVPSIRIEQRPTASAAPPGDRAGPRARHPPARASAKASEIAPRSFDTTYYSIRQLDIYPAPAEPLRLKSLAHVLAGDERARAVVELHISETGGVEAAKVIEAHPSGHFESELAQLFLAARFTPAVREGRAVRSRVLVRVE